MTSTTHGYTGTTKSGEHLLNRKCNVLKLETKLLYSWDLFFHSCYTCVKISNKSCITREITALSTKKIKIFYIQKSTVHYVTLILDDPLYISNFDTRKVMSFFQHLHVLIICTLHLLCLYPMTREKSNFEWKLLFVYLLTLQLFGNKYVFYYNFFLIYL